MFNDRLKSIKSVTLRDCLVEAYDVFCDSLLEAAGVNGGAGIMLINKNNGKILLCKRSGDSDAPNQWCGLGGGIEDGEEPLVAAKRELMEEASISPESYELIDESPLFIHNTASGFVFNNFYAYCEDDEPKLNDEHTDYKWVSIVEMNEMKDLHYGYRTMLSEQPVYDKIVTAINNLQQ